MNEELAKKAVACKHWKWMPGMLAPEGRVEKVDKQWIYIGGTWYGDSNSGDEALRSVGGPVLDDPATIGCLMALVRRAWQDPLAQCSVTWPGWRVWLEARGKWAVRGGQSEAEALISALETAPPQKEESKDNEEARLKERESVVDYLQAEAMRTQNHRAVDLLDDLASDIEEGFHLTEENGNE